MTALDAFVNLSTVGAICSRVGIGITKLAETVVTRSLVDANGIAMTVVPSRIVAFTILHLAR